MNRNIKIIVSNPLRQHTHQLCNGLEKFNYLKYFYTTLWYNPHNRITKILCTLPYIGSKIKNIYLKRYDEKLPINRIKTNINHELTRQFQKNIPFTKKDESLLLKMEQKYDKQIAKLLKEEDFDIFIGYEKSCYNCFNVVKNKGKIAVLDLAQVHSNFIHELREKYPVFKSMQNEKLFQKICSVKEKEYQLMDHILTLSSFAADTLIKNGIAKERIHTVNLGFDPSKFTPKENYNLEPKKNLNLLYAGTITKRKGIHILFEAVKQLDNVTLTIVGPVLDGQDILERYKDYYTYFPFLHHNELAKKYKEADLFVFPSFLDSWAMVVLEAMACGTPVIVSENTGSKDAVKKGGGKIIPVDDVEALKTAIESYCKDRSLIEKDGIKAHNVAQEYTWDNYYNQINNVISKISKDCQSNLHQSKVCRLV